MMEWFVSLLFGIGFGTWIYSILMKNTMRAQPSLIGGGVAGFVGALVLFTLIKFVFHF